MRPPNRSFSLIAPVLVVLAHDLCGCTVEQYFGSPVSGDTATGTSGASGSGSGGADVASDPAKASWEWLNPQPQGNTLRGIWGTASNDVWLVGSASTVMHWDGSAWSNAYPESAGDTFYTAWG